MGDRGLDLTAANGEPIPYDGWVELTFNLPVNEDSSLFIRVPFLVSCVSLTSPILGFNVFQELIQGQEDGVELITIIAQLLQKGMQIGEDTAGAIVNLIPTQKHTQDQALVRVGW